MSAMGAAVGGGGGMGPDKGLKMSLLDTLRLAWADSDIRSRIMFVLFIFGVYALAVHIPVPVRGLDPTQMEEMLQGSALFQMLNTFGGGALRRVSILALGLNPYITASIITQVLTMANPAWKKELQEGGEYARRQQNKRTRLLTLILCVFQGGGLVTAILQGTQTPWSWDTVLPVLVFWTAGSMLLLWLGEQVSERGIGNGISLLIFAGIVISLPNVFSQVFIWAQTEGNFVAWLRVLVIAAIFLATTVFIVVFTIAQRRIPIAHMRRNFGTQSMGGHTSYLPISVNMAGVIPIIFAVALAYLPLQVAGMFPPASPMSGIARNVAVFFTPDFTRWEGYVGILFYSVLIFFFTYFWNAMMYNVEDIANNLKRGGSYIPGYRPGKQTKEFLDGVISRVTFVGAMGLAIAALSQYVFPLVAPIPNLGLIGGTSLLIMVSVALETMRQIESNILVKQYGG